MINGKTIAVVMPAYNAEKTLEKTVRELSEVVDIKILVDYSSKDQTAQLSRKLGVRTFVHDANYGYGRNQQTCYREALAAGADIVVMVHPDYQYTPSLVPAMAGMVASGSMTWFWFANFGRRSPEGRNALLQVCCQPPAHRVSEPVSGREPL